MNTGVLKAQRIRKPLLSYMPNRFSMSRRIAIPLRHFLECWSMAKQKNPAAVALGRLGGKKSAKGRMEKMTPEQRKEVARQAAKARWTAKKK
jgi:hypothetical protein